MTALRPPAVPLITVDPYFSIWSFADCLYEDHTRHRLAFDCENTGSIKYNLVWDKILRLDIFDKDIFELEVDYYQKKINTYGLPLDCRSDYTKSDWQMWSTMLTDNTQYRDKIISAMINMLNHTPHRVPFTDWYFTTAPYQSLMCGIHGFQNRSVQGGLLINLLC